MVIMMGISFFNLSPIIWSRLNTTNTSLNIKGDFDRHSFQDQHGLRVDVMG